MRQKEVERAGKTEQRERDRESGPARVTGGRRSVEQKGGPKGDSERSEGQRAKEFREREGERERHVLGVGGETK